MLIGTCGASAIFSLRGATPSRAKEEGWIALPELSITPEKHHVLVRTAHYFLRERHIKECPLRFDVVAIDNTPGQPPVVRLHKVALIPQARQDEAQAISRQGSQGAILGLHNPPLRSSVKVY